MHGQGVRLRSCAHRTSRAGWRVVCSASWFPIPRAGRWTVLLKAGSGDLGFLLRGSSFLLCTCLHECNVNFLTHSFDNGQRLLVSR